MALLATPSVQQGATMKKPNKDQVTLSELERILSDRTAVAARDFVKLRDAICAYQFAEQARGTPIQTIKIRLTRVVGKAGKGTHAETSIAVQELLDWCIRYAAARVPAARPLPS
jgi:hypothetical protein